MVACGAAVGPCNGRSLCGAPPQVDSLDTLFILGLDDEFSRAATWLGENLRFGEQEGISLFEVTTPCATRTRVLARRAALLRVAA